MGDTYDFLSLFDTSLNGVYLPLSLIIERLLNITLADDPQRLLSIKLALPDMSRGAGASGHVEASGTKCSTNSESHG